MKAAKRDNGYKELNDLYQSVLNSLLSYSKLTAMYSSNSIYPWVPDKVAGDRVLKALTQDIETHTASLKRLHKKHAHFKGAPKTGDEFNTCLSLGGKYADLQDKIQAATFPLSRDLDQHIIKANHAKQEAVSK